MLFPENGSFASVACASYRTLNASTAAPEPHDFTVRIRARTSIAPSASIASHRAFVTFASAPQSGETGGVMPLICVRTKAEYFSFADLTLFLKIRNDLPVVLFCRSRASRLRLREKQISSQQLTRISAAICGSRENDEGPGCRAHPGYTLMSAPQLKQLPIISPPRK